MKRQSDGRETWHRLLNWDKGQSPSERLAAQILIAEKYDAVDPSHPLGGRDGLKDILCKKQEFKFVAACYFSRGQQSFQQIKNKFEGDLAGIEKNNADGIAFITNQELTLSEREDLLQEVNPEKKLDLFHLERLTTILNSPFNYGIRLEFLDIEMTKEEQLAYMSSKDQVIHELMNVIKQLLPSLKAPEKENAFSIPVALENYNAQGGYFGFGVIPPYQKCSYCGYSYKI